MSPVEPLPARSAPLIPWREMLSLDLRSLALLRIGLGVLLVLDWLDRLPDLRAHYSDDGVFPRQVLEGILPISIHLFHGSTWFQGVLAGIAFVLAGLLIVGYRTPVITLFNWLMLLSVHGRNVSLLQGGDNLLRLLLFWGMFLPLGACWSIDARGPRAKPREKSVASVATFAFILQLCLVYLFASAWKWAPEWRDDGTAVHQALSVECFTTRFGLWLREQESLCRALTYSTLYLEALGPALLFLPFSVSRQRLFVIASFLMFHVGLAITLELGNFPWVCCVMWLALVPTAFWDRLERQLGWRQFEVLLPSPTVLKGRGVGGEGEVARTEDPLTPNPSPPSTGARGTGEESLISDPEPAWAAPRGSISRALLILCMVYVFLWNLRYFDYQKNRYLFPDQMSQIGWTLGLEQGWGLFAPRPGRLSGWFVMVGTLADGTKVDLYNGGGPVDTTRPELISATYANGRWRKMITNLTALSPSGNPMYPPLLPGYARYLSREWTREHGTANPLRVVEIIYMQELVMPPGEKADPPQPITLIRYEPQDES